MIGISRWLDIFGAGESTVSLREDLRQWLRTNAFAPEWPHDPQYMKEWREAEDLAEMGAALQFVDGPMMLDLGLGPTTLRGIGGFAGSFGRTAPRKTPVWLRLVDEAGDVLWSGDLARSVDQGILEGAAHTSDGLAPSYQLPRGYRFGPYYRSSTPRLDVGEHQLFGMPNYDSDIPKVSAYLMPDSAEGGGFEFFSQFPPSSETPSVAHWVVGEPGVSEATWPLESFDRPSRRVLQAADRNGDVEGVVIEIIVTRTYP